MSRGLFAAFRPFTDDRGKPTGLVAPGAVSTVEKIPKHWQRLYQTQENLSLLGFGLLHVPSVLIGSWLGFSGWQSWAVVLVIELPILMALGPLLTRPLFHPNAHIYRHQVVASGACASCGYRITGLPAAPDACVACPECGAAWRTERLASVEPLDGAERRRKLRSKLPPVISFTGGLPTTDHRGRAATLSVFRGGPRLESDYGRACQRTANAIREHGNDSAGTVMGACFIGAACIFLLLFAMQSSPGAAPWWATPLMALFPALLFCGFAIGVSDARVSTEQLEAAALQHGICPSCWELLEGLHPDPDGCTTCPECGSSWELPEPGSRAPQPPAPDAQHQQHVEPL